MDNQSIQHTFQMETYSRKEGIPGESTQEQLVNIILPELEQFKEMIDVICICI